MAEARLLELRDLETFYGSSQVLFGLSLAVGAGQPAPTEVEPAVLVERHPLDGGVERHRRVALGEEAGLEGGERDHAGSLANMCSDDQRL